MGGGRSGEGGGREGGGGAEIQEWGRLLLAPSSPQLPSGSEAKTKQNNAASVLALRRATLF